MAELQQRMGASEFADWCAFLAVEPTGSERTDLHTAMLLTLLANVNRDRKKRREPWQIEDFLFSFWTPATAPAPEPGQLLNKFKALVGNAEHS